MRSYIGWVDLADGDVRRAKTVIAAFKQEDTIDALGFQRLAEPFAERFYPATSTQMTRARYFIFVPAIYSLLARMKRGANALRDESERIQTELMRNLRKHEPERGAGVIGRRAEDDLERFPSDIYWAALRELGILVGRSTERQHRQTLAAREQDEAVATDDQTTSHTEERPQHWGEVQFDDVLAGNRLRSKLTFGLTRREADYLIRRWRAVAEDRGASLMSERLATRAGDDIKHPWNWPARDETLRRFQPHAKAFSAATRALSLVYELLVAEKQAAGADVIDGIRDSFVTWCKQGPAIVSRWDVEKFWQLPGMEQRHHDDPKAFSVLAEKCTSTSDPTRLLTNTTLRDSVIKREADNRPRKCRLCGRAEHGKYLRQWERPHVSAQRETFELDFRHAVGQRILRDLLRVEAKVP